MCEEERVYEIRRHLNLRARRFLGILWCFQVQPIECCDLLVFNSFGVYSTNPSTLIDEVLNINQLLLKLN